MKKALRLFFMYFAFLVIGLVLGTFFYSLFLHSLEIVSDRHFQLLNKDILIQAFFMTFYVLFFFMAMLLLCYRIRHPGNIFQLIFFVILIAFTWIFAYPCLNILEEKYYEKHPVKNEQLETLTKDVFRVYGDNVYYFMDEMEDSYAAEEKGCTTIKINTSETGVVSVIDIKNPAALDIVKNAKPYRDILIRDTFISQDSFNLSVLTKLVLTSKIEYHKGFTFWIGFLSLGFALACVYGISLFSDWKMINFCNVIVMTFLLFFMNVGFYAPQLDFLRNSNLVQNKLMMELSQFFSTPFLVIFNLICGLIMIIIGFINSLLKKRKARKNKAEV